MRKSYRYLASWLMAGLFSITAYAQTITISGTVRNNDTQENLPGVSVTVKGTSQGTTTNANGEFTLKVSQLPVVLVFSSVGYAEQEVTVSSATTPVSVNMAVSSIMGEEIVMAASRTPERILKAPVTVERMSSNALRNVAAPNYYEALGNLKGVDVHTASLTFRTITTRGFVSSGNTRLNQLIDKMNNQAPGLNFAVGNVIGLTELDVDNVEILSGASSALYGSGGMNGTVLITSKNPFKFPGLSYNIKQGIMHVDHKQQTRPAPYYDWAFRWAQPILNDRVAIKLAAQLTKGSDWQAEDYRNKRQIGILSEVVGGNRTNDPAYNGINVYGDETSVNMNGFSFFVMESTRRAIDAATDPFVPGPGGINVIAAADAYFAAIGNPAYPTNAQIAGFITMLPAPVQPAVQNMMPFYIGFRRNYFNNANVSRTGYEEELLVDYNTLNVKLTGGLHWKMFSNRVEGSWNTYFGTGTTVYTGADRYSLRNLKMAQHKLEFNGKNWFALGYTTQENAGESYNATAVGAFLNEAYSPSSVWFPTYIATFSEMRRLGGPVQSDITIHNNVRTVVDANRLVPGTQAFDLAMRRIRTTPIVKGGALFLDRSDLWGAEAQANISNISGFSDAVEVLGGLGWKQWVMNSQGTIFADNVDSIGYTKVPRRGNITISEIGLYLQFRKSLLNDALTLTASGRWDKQSNFKGRFTPRLSAVVRVARENFVRLSYQTAYRFPTNQDQYISLITGSGALIGGLPEFQTYYKLNSTLPGYTAESVLPYRAGTIADSNRLVVATYKPLVPETVYSYELGYKGMISKILLFDAYVYYSHYRDFLVNAAVVQSRTGPQYEVYSPFSSNNISYKQNSTETVKALGWGIGADYQFIPRFFLYGNLFSDQLRDLPKGAVTFFNAPKYRFNIGLRSENAWKNIGFNFVVKWQDNNYYEGTFVTGTLPYFTWVDGQITYRPPNTKSTFRIGGTNLGNSYYRTGYGSPAVGGVYYVSYGYNIF
ncbi:MAG TPA: TonB-dependent receptor [Chitinophagaceae bacterium]|nr:TonB-dependent receptor [Chitinophagaceae bacterium]